MLARAVGWLIHRQAAVTSKSRHRITLFILGYRVADEVGNGSRDPHSVVARSKFLLAPGPEDAARRRRLQEKRGWQRRWRNRGGAKRVLIDEKKAEYCRACKLTVRVQHKILSAVAYRPAKPTEIEASRALDGDGRLYSWPAANESAADRPHPSEA